MTGKALFALGLRILGLVFLYHAVRAAVFAGSVVLGGMSLQPMVVSVFQCLAYAAASLWLIGGAPWLFRWAFREHKSETKSHNESRETGN